MATRVAIYTRVSTSQQSTDGQREELTSYAERRGWQIHRIYEDKGVSGAKDSRPALDELMRDARQRRFDLVLVWKFDRFARSLNHLISGLNLFQELGLDFCSFTESIDTSTSTGKLVFHVLGAIAEFERSLIRERVQAGVDRARANGTRFGRPRAGFDYARAVIMRERGCSYREIAKTLGVSHSTIIRALKRDDRVDQKSEPK